MKSKRAKKERGRGARLDRGRDVLSYWGPCEVPEAKQRMGEGLVREKALHRKRRPAQQWDK